MQNPGYPTAVVVILSPVTRSTTSFAKTILQGAACRGRQTNKSENSFHERSGLTFGTSRRTAENRQKWQALSANRQRRFNDRVATRLMKYVT